MATLFIVIGKGKAKLKSGDKIVQIDLNKYDLGDVPKLLLLAKVVASGKINEDAYKFLGISKDEVSKYDKIKICMEDSFTKIIKGKIKVPDIGYDLFSCE